MAITNEDMIALEEDMGLRTVEAKRRYHKLQINILNELYEIVKGEDVKLLLVEETLAHQKRLDMLLSCE